MRRIRIALALGCAVLGLSAGDAAAKITVDTNEDILTEGVTPSVTASLNACVEALTSLQGPNVAIPPDDVPPVNAGSVGRADASKCSLRMAIVAANVTGESISIDLPAGQDTIELAVQAAGAAGVRVVPLPPIAREITLDGCGASTGATTPCVNVVMPDVVPVVGDLVGNTAPLLEGDTPGLIVASSEVKIKGIAFVGGDSPSILVPPKISKVEISNCYFGLTTAGVTDGKPLVGVQSSGTDILIGGEENGTRNVFLNGGIGVYVLGGTGNVVQGNYFGATPAGVESTTQTTKTGIKITGLGLDASEAGEAVSETVPNPPQAVQNLGRLLTIQAAANNTIKDNLIVDMTVAGLDVGGKPITAGTSGDLVGAHGTQILGNKIGVDARGSEAGNNANVSISNGSYDTKIGGTGAGEPNVFGASDSDGVDVLDNAGLNTTFELNFGIPGNSRLLFDLGDDDAGNAENGPNGGIQEPVITLARGKRVEGTGTKGATVSIYSVASPANSIGHGDPAAELGEATVGDDGKWGTDLAKTAGGQVVATQTIGGKGTSELSQNFTVAPSTPSRGGGGGQQQQQGNTGGDSGMGSSQKAESNPPAVVTVAGKKPSATGVTVVRDLRALTGRLDDASGIKKVLVALQVLPGRAASRGRARRSALAAAKRKKKAPAAKCTWVDLLRGRFVRRSCSSPLFAQAEGGARWRLPLAPKTRALLKRGVKRGQKYLLYIRATDTLGNTSTNRYQIKVV